MTYLRRCTRRAPGAHCTRLGAYLGGGGLLGPGAHCCAFVAILKEDWAQGAAHVHCALLFTLTAGCTARR
jgi:hypothetical protein